MMSAGCGPTYDFAQPSYNENASKVPEPITGAPRPEPEQRINFDYASLPLLALAPSTKGEVTMTFSGSPRAQDGFVGVLDASERRTFTEGPWGLSTSSPTSAYSCSTGSGETPATWVAVHPDKKKARSFEVLEHVGVVDGERCATRAQQVYTAAAAGIVPGVLYAYRRCAAPAGQPPAPNAGPVPTRAPCEEELVLIGPPLEWVTSTGETIDKHLRPQIGSFSRIVVPVRRATAASVLVHVRHQNLFMWGGANVLGASFERAATVQLTTDVSWASADPAPLGTVSIAAVGPPR